MNKKPSSWVFRIKSCEADQLLELIDPVESEFMISSNLHKTERTKSDVFKSCLIDGSSEHRG